MFSRRAALGVLAGALSSPALAGAHPSLAYMNVAAKDLLNANRQGTLDSFRQAILRHADVAAIAEYSLGQYKDKLTAAQRDAYYAGVATFMSRYFAVQSRDFHVAKYELGEATADGASDVLIDSKVYLMSGQTYTVAWRLTWSHGGYKISDVKVLGFSLVYLQRGLFTSFISKRNGDVAQLVAALNR